jgi:putative PEP-CTERM system TPR-repeat lipoprotein
LAEALAASGKYQQVVDLLAQDQDLATRLLVFRGDAYLSIGKVEEAQQDYLAVLDRNPRMVPALLGIARVDILQGHTALALSRIRQAISAAPDSARPWSLLGDIELKNRRISQALDAYQTALRQSSGTAPEVRLRIAMLLIDQGRLDEARKMVDSLPEQSQKSPTVQVLDAALSLKEGHADRTADILNRLTALYPNNAQALLYLSLALLEQQKYEQAISVLKNYRRLRSADAVGSRLLGIAHARGGSFKQAERLLLPLLETNPQDSLVLEALRLASTRAGDYDQAAAYESQLASLSQVREQLGDALAFIDQGDRGAALALLEQTTELYPKYYQVRLLQYRELIREQKFSEAADVAGEMQELLPDSAQPQLLLGIALAGQNHYEVAMVAIKAAWAINPGNPEIGHRLAVLQQISKDSEQAKQTYQEVLAANPGHTETFIRAAILNVRLDDQGAVLDYLKQAVDSAPGELRPRLLLSETLARRGDIDQSLEVLQEVSERFDKDPIYVARIFQLQIALKDWPGAIASGERLVELKPQSALAHLHLAEAYGHAGDLAALSAEISTALTLEGPTGLSSNRMVQLASLGGDQDDGRSLLERLLKQHPDNAELVSALVSLATKEQRYDEALALLRDMQKRFPDEIRWSTLEIQTLYRAGDSETATQRLQQAKKRHPDASDLKMLEASIALRQNDSNQAVERYLQVIVDQPNNVPALNNLAWLMLENDPVKALDYATRAVSLSRHPQVLDTYGMVMLSNKNPQAAVKVLRIAATKKPDSAEITFHLAKALAASGNSQEAKQILQPLLDDNTPFDDRAEAQTLYEAL